MLVHANSDHAQKNIWPITVNTFLQTTPPLQQGRLEFIINPTEQINIIGERQLAVHIKEELPDDCDIMEIKDEHQTGMFLI